MADVTTTTITIDKAADEFVEFAYQDDAGNAVDISQANVVFAIKNSSTTNLAPILNPDDPTGCLFHFTPAYSNALSAASGKDFHVILTDPETGFKTDLWQGTITTVGFQ